ncbi:UbiA prenyltransferase [Parachaetomium inaequale]|uniref:UbiA prenyltransferase n=1 Tax=Parachaetomium inaequale TaxID=2588326 RepID=A0AAN6SL58_9PEZI|nr:UbiA prenyltransferase [Parachaetomium inaequale]
MTDVEPEGTEQQVRTPWFHLQSLLLFTRSDIKTSVLPQGVFAIGTALAGGQMTVAEVAVRIPIMLGWSWLHLLVFNIAGQRLATSILEDSINKPWRPLPSGRVSPAEAVRLLRPAIATAIIVSVTLGNYPASAACMIYGWIYNELDGSSAGPIERNFWNAVGLGCLGWGSAEALLGGHNSARLGNGALGTWLLLTSAVVFTTVHAQDMEDVVGDRARGRRTAPLVYGEAAARTLLAVSVLLWSVVCPVFWNVPHTTAIWYAPLCVGVAMADLTITRWDLASSKLMFNLWCAWLGLLYILPVFGLKHAF